MNPKKTAWISKYKRLSDKDKGALIDFIVGITGLTRKTVAETIVIGKSELSIPQVEIVEAKLDEWLAKYYDLEEQPEMPLAA